MQNFPRITTPEGCFYYMNEEYLPNYLGKMVDYANMAKAFMNRPFDDPLKIVGNIEWHEEFPYEQYLGFDEVEYKNKLVLDFGCGPGRMINRFNRFSEANGLGISCDGVDISDYAVEYAQKKYPQSKFYVSSGMDIGQVPPGIYDLIFSTICIQHIPVRSIRNNIFRAMHNTLRTGGVMSVQVAYNETMQAGVWSHDTEHASYESDFWNAKATNGHADVVINKDSLPIFINDLKEIFEDVTYQLVRVDDKYHNLNGRYHAPYWASHWLFTRGKKS